MEAIHFCRHCGKEIESDSLYCSFCGKPIEKKESNDPIEYGAKWEVLDQDLTNANIEEGAKWGGSGLSQLSEIVQRKVVELEFPQAQGGGKTEVVLASLSNKNPRMIWFENTEGKTLTSPFASKEEYFHYNSVELYSPNGLFSIWFYSNGHFYDLLKSYKNVIDTSSDLFYCYGATSMVNIENNNRVNYDNVPDSSSGFFRIGEYLISLDDYSLYRQIIEKKQVGASPIELLGLCALALFLIGGGAGGVMVAFAELFGIDLPEGVFWIVATIVGLISVICVIGINSKDNVYNVKFERLSQGRNL